MMNPQSWRMRLTIFSSKQVLRNQKQLQTVIRPECIQVIQTLYSLSMETTMPVRVALMWITRDLCWVNWQTTRRRYLFLFIDWQRQWFLFEYYSYIYYCTFLQTQMFLPYEHTTQPLCRHNCQTLCLKINISPPSIVQLLNRFFLTSQPKTYPVLWRCNSIQWWSLLFSPDTSHFFIEQPQKSPLTQAQSLSAYLSSLYILSCLQKSRKVNLSEKNISWKRPLWFVLNETSSSLFRGMSELIEEIVLYLGGPMVGIKNWDWHLSELLEIHDTFFLFLICLKLVVFNIEMVKKEVVSFEGILLLRIYSKKSNLPSHEVSK